MGFGDFFRRLLVIIGNEVIEFIGMCGWVAGIIFKKRS